jgi:hypothetical protein
MSIETVQFVEMIRQAAAALPPRLAQRPAAGYALHCDKCGRATTHAVHDRGVDEIYTCSVCGQEQVFRVR